MQRIVLKQQNDAFRVFPDEPHLAWKNPFSRRFTNCKLDGIVQIVHPTPSRPTPAEARDMLGLKGADLVAL